MNFCLSAAVVAAAAATTVARWPCRLIARTMPSARLQGRECLPRASRRPPRLKVFAPGRLTTTWSADLAGRRTRVAAHLNPWRDLWALEGGNIVGVHCRRHAGRADVIIMMWLDFRNRLHKQGARPGGSSQLHKFACLPVHLLRCARAVFVCVQVSRARANNQLTNRPRAQFTCPRLRPLASRTHRGWAP